MQSRKATHVEKTPNDVYRDVGLESGIPAEDIAAIGGLESGHGEFDRPIKGGSARGLFQFQPKTAEDLESGSSDSLEDLDTQAKLMKLYLEKNKVDNAEDAFVKHNLGSTGGEKFLLASDDDPITSVVPERVIKANPIYNVKTVGEAKQKIKEKLQKGRDSSNVRPNFLDLFKEKK